MEENIKTISEQEIKEAIEEIAQKEKDEEHIKNIQEIFELNSWLLEKLTDEQLKAEYIKLLYNREHLTDRLLDGSGKKHENEVLGKMILEIVLKYSKKKYPSEIKSDLEIFSLLCGSDWKERTGFAIKEKEVCWKGVHSYRAKPQEIVENYYFKQEEENEKQLAKKEEKIKAFEKVTLGEENDLSNQFSLLNKLYKNETDNLKLLIEEYETKDLSKLFKDDDEKKKYVEGLKKELKEKKILIEKLETKEKVARLKEEIKNLKEQSNQLTAQVETKK